MSHVLTDDEAVAYLALGITPREVMRLRWPNLNDQEADWLLWEETPWPMVSGLHDLADALAEMPGYVSSILDAKPRRSPRHRRHVETHAGIKTALTAAQGASDADEEGA